MNPFHPGLNIGLPPFRPRSNEGGGDTPVTVWGDTGSGQIRLIPESINVSEGDYPFTVREGTPIVAASVLDGYSAVRTTNADALASLYASADAEFTVIVVARRLGDDGASSGLIGTLDNGNSQGWGLISAFGDMYFEIYTTDVAGVFYNVITYNTDWNVFCYQINSSGQHFGGVNGFTEFLYGDPPGPPGACVPSSLPIAIGYPIAAGINYPGEIADVLVSPSGDVDMETALGLLKTKYPSLPIA